MEFELGTTQHTADNRLAGSGPDVTAREQQGELVGLQQRPTRIQHDPRHRRNLAAHVQRSCMTGRDYQGINKAFLDAIPAHLSQSLTLGADQILYPAGGVIHGPGSRVRPGVLEAGLLRAYFTSRDGREATVTYIGSGEAVGLSTFFGEAPAVSLQALTDTRILHFEESRFAALLSTEVDIALAVAACFDDRYVTGSQSVHRLVFGPGRARVAGPRLGLATRDPDWPHARNITQ